MKLRYSLFFILCCLFFIPQKALAEEQHILLVYDSLNIAENKQNDVDSIQRLLTSFGASVQTVEEDKYISGMMFDQKFDGVITMINWSDKELNEQFIQDRSRFSGKKLHIGSKVAPDEQQLFTGKWRDLSHRQFTLEDERDRYSQILNYREKTTVLEEAAGEKIGRLRAQEIDDQAIPFGVLENGHGFLPFFDKKGAVFLKSAELMGSWLEVEQSYNPILTIDGLNPMKDMGVASDFQKALSKVSIPYIVSTTSVNRNNTTKPYNVFTDVLRSFESGSGIIFLEMPVVNNVNLNDNHALAQLLEQQISLLIDRSVFPVGFSAHGYWNQDAQYQADGLKISKTIILRENPPIEDQHYRGKTNNSDVFNTAFYNLPFEYLAGISWKKDGVTADYSFPMPVTMSFSFPDSKREIKKIIQDISNSPLQFYKVGQHRFQFDVQTQTQHIEFLNSRRYLNGNLVNSLKNIPNTEVTETVFRGQFARFFNVTNIVLIVFVLSTLAILSILFIFGRRNYRSKYIQKKRGSK
ncbi:MULTISPECIES: hypothetical protein [unclassified Enterococcus]|uniref:hypothetical protein n=1 Tax=unclassified Enterococcus TaxID=2608891 RepID=UPI001CE21D6E|nr:MULTISPECIES: hypothetical protein [unclassified Enterococcus]